MTKMPLPAWVDMVTMRVLEEADPGGNPWPPEVAHYAETGGARMRVAQAMEEAGRDARRDCLDDLEHMLRELPDDADILARVYLEGEIARLHRRMSPTPERTREQTRERVRRHRRCKRAEA